MKLALGVGGQDYVVQIMFNTSNFLTSLAKAYIKSLVLYTLDLPTIRVSPFLWAPGCIQYMYHGRTVYALLHRFTKIKL